MNILNSSLPTVRHFNLYNVGVATSATIATINPNCKYAIVKFLTFNQSAGANYLYKTSNSQNNAITSPVTVANQTQIGEISLPPNTVIGFNKATGDNSYSLAIEEYF